LQRPQLPQLSQLRDRQSVRSAEPLSTVDLPTELGVTAHPDGTFSDQSYDKASAADTGSLDEPVAHPFWQDEGVKADPLDLPTKGLVTRRGEAQKIAHELTTQADAAFRKKDYKEAEKYYLQAAVKDPDNARIYNRLGVIYLRTKNYKDAVEAFRGSIKFDDRVASRHYNLALAYVGKKDYRLAEKAVREAIRLEPTNDKYRQTLEALSQ
jgi:tetratricopeptide (TPR) repeat protein